MRTTATLLPPFHGRRSRRVLAGGVLSVVLLLGLFVMHAIGLHGSTAGHVLPAAHHAGVMATAEHHPAGPDAEVVADGRPAVTLQTAGDGASAAVVACVAILLLTALLSLPRIRLPQGWVPPRPPSLRSLRAPAIATSPAPLFQILCVSRT